MSHHLFHCLKTSEWAVSLINSNLMPTSLDLNLALKYKIRFRFGNEMQNVTLTRAARDCISMS